MAVEQGKVDEVMDQVIGDFAAMIGVQLTAVGLRTGLWKAMAGGGPLSPTEVATRSGVDERLVGEWLKGQAASGYVTYDPSTQRFALPDEVAAVMVDEPNVKLVDGFTKMLLAMSTDMPLMEEAFRTGRGLPWGARSPQHHEGMDDATTAAVVPALLSSWLPAVDGVEDRLRAGAKVADVGCGYGAPVIAMAKAYPNTTLWGFDCHDASIARARKAAAEGGVGDRAKFEVSAAANFPGTGYDLVTYFDSFHDLGDPVGALAHTREALAPDGSVLLVEWNGADRVEDNLHALGRLFYASSALVCTANALSQEGHAIGTLAGETRLREVAEQAGFTRIRRVPADAPLNLLLELSG